MTFQELIQTCVDEFGKDDAQWIGRFKRYLNRGNREVFNSKDWPFARDFDNTFNTVVGTETYTLTETNIRKLLNVTINTDGKEKRLSPVNYGEFKTIYPHVDTASEQGTPNEYYPQSRSATYQLILNLYPVPDAAVEIGYDFVKDATEMTSDSDTPDFPDNYHDLLVDYTLWKSYQHVRDLVTAREYQSQYRENLRSMIGDYQVTESQELQFVRFDGQEVEEQLWR